jgi:hypothetical protein
MKVTTEQLVKAFAARGMGVQWLRSGPRDEDRRPHTAGTISLESIVAAINEGQAAQPEQEQRK